MKMPDFDDLVAEYRRTAIPALPSSFSSHVLREIRLRSAEAKCDAGWLSSLFSCLRPGMVAASLIVALAVGVLAPGFGRANDNSTVVAGLGLHVFSSSSSNFPSSLHR